jgi:hypothetical protein
MKHLAEGALAESVRGVGDRSMVEAHLAVCWDCARAASLYKSMIQTNAREAQYAPPAGLERSVKAWFATQQPTKQASRLAMLFDSLLEPLAAGVRSSVASARQLLYRVDSIYVDMRIDSESGSERATLVGQLLDASRAGKPVDGVKLTLLGGDSILNSAVSNENGEFQLEFTLRDHVQLLVALDPSAPVCVPISGTKPRPATGVRGM